MTTFWRAKSNSKQLSRPSILAHDDPLGTGKGVRNRFPGSELRASDQRASLSRQLAASRLLPARQPAGPAFSPYTNMGWFCGPSRARFFNLRETHVEASDGDGESSAPDGTSRRFSKVMPGGFAGSDTRPIQERSLRSLHLCFESLPDRSRNKITAVTAPANAPIPMPMAPRASM